MSMHLLRNSRLILGAIVLSFWGCAPSLKIEEFAETASSSDEIQRLSMDLKTAEEQQVDVFAPTAFQEASDSLADAQGRQKDGDDAKDILHEVAKGRAYLDQANRSSQASQSSLSEIAAARIAALKSGAVMYYPKDLEAADAQLRSITKKLEDKSAARDDEQLKILQREYLEVELKSIKQANLGPAIKIVDQAIKEGAKENAQQSLAVAEKSIRDAESYIVANRYQTDEVKSRAEKATFAANYLLKITRASKAGKNISSEEAAILMERERIKTAAESDKLQAERQAASVVAGTVRNLASEKEFNQRFVVASSEFGKDEADVYRQGDKLLVRLKSLEFQVNQSTLQSANFAVLGKLSKVIKSFQNPVVSVEGHTDSDGSAVRNKKLSIERANAVANYLISSNAIEPSRVTVMGWGSERPLGSNKTATGKAQNRRVDVVISSPLTSH